MAKENGESDKSVEVLPRCGIIMPISAIDGCSENHWSDVREIVTDAIEDAGFEANLVSDADDIGIIQKRIIQNVYENPIVVCDVSGKNPNVMFELGMRLAFDKPTLIVKDDKTSYSFDTSPIEHIPYPRDLRFPLVVAFKETLVEKLKGTYEKATKDPNYTTFLKNFGTFSIAKLDTKEVSTNEYIIEELKSIKEAIRRDRLSGLKLRLPPDPRDVVCLRGTSMSMVESLAQVLSNEHKIMDAVFRSVGEDHYHLWQKGENILPAVELLELSKRVIPSARIISRGKKVTKGQ